MRGGEERAIANTIKARYDAGVSKFKQDGTAVAIPVSFADGQIIKEIDNAHCLSAYGPGKEGIHTHQEMNRVIVPVEEKRACIPVLTPDRAEKRQNGRRFKEDGDPSFTLTAQDIHGVAISGNVVSESGDTAHCLNANDQRKVFGANQERTMVGVLRAVRSEYGKEIRKDYEAGNIKISRHDFQEHEIREDGLTNTIDSVQKDNMVAMKVKEATKQGYALAHKGDSINLSMPDSQTRRGRVGGQMAQTLDTQCNQGTMEVIPGTIPDEDGRMVEIYPGTFVWAVWYEKYHCYIAIRKLTPRECFRLQGWSDEYFDRAQFVNTDSQLYKQAGNGVTVNVVQTIAERLGNERQRHNKFRS